jgi:hypothetical protein
MLSLNDRLRSPAKVETHKRLVVTHFLSLVEKEGHHRIPLNFGGVGEKRIPISFVH